jgi:broad specificity phosphatase PhoE
MDLDYKNKYLKYKMKYLILQKQIGSAQPSGQTLTSIIVTHNGRMRCLLDTLGLSDENINPENKRFMNCAVLELNINPTNISANLRVAGDLAGEGDLNKYFTSINKTVLNNSINTNGNTFIFYVIRHGHGKHNLAKDLGTFNKVGQIITMSLYDPDLTNAQDQENKKNKMTSNGEQQAINSGQELIKQLPNLKIDYLFASDLKRTRQTLYKFLEGTGGNILNPTVRTVTILPCAHELDYQKNGCDGNQRITAQENTMECNEQTICPTDPIKHEQNNYCSSIPAISKDPNAHNLCLNWEFYKVFYGGTRNNKKSSNQCRNTNMIQQSIMTIQSNSDINAYRKMIENK